ncbi:MAG: AMP-binding protein [Candidatus Helarchaeota archaeon]|nr:AMP-binding protein [Candidatus Helarchaeota archaeon]
MNLTQELFKDSHKLDKIAFFHRDETISYPDLYAKICTVIEELKKQGCKKGEKIAIFANNSIFTVIAYFGIIGNGIVAIPLYPRISEEHLNYIIKGCEIKTLFIQNKLLKRFEERCKVKMKNYFIDAESEFGININALPKKEIKFPEIDEKKETAVIVFTSGSTGVPKGVMVSHHNVNYNADSIIEYLKLTEKDRFMEVLPFSYCYGTSWLHTHMKVGGQLVINNRFMFPGKVLDEINEKECTGFGGVPAHYQILLRRSNIHKRKFPSLRYFAQAGGKLAVPFIKELMELFPNKQIFIMYGQTEATARLSYLPPDLLEKKLGSIGKGIPRVTLEVLKKDGSPIKPGEVGEIVAEGGNIMQGYWNDPEGTKKTLKEGKLYTGDLATIDEEGFLFLVDREKNIIKSGGYRVSPQEIENVIFQIPNVVEAAVIGVPDEILGEAIKAFVVTIKDAKSLIDKDYIVKYCRKQLPSHKIPRYVEFIRNLPKSSSNKVMYEVLKKQEREKK